jgi:chlorobactene glucosyltransferase
VSVLVPARNEAHNLPKLFAALQRLQWPKLELLLLNDHSEDATAAVATEQAHKLPAANWQNIEVLNGQPLPEGWLGKSWACHQLAAQAQGRYLLFLDADVSPQPQLVQSLFGYAQQQKLAVLSLFPQQQMLSFAERVVVPIMHLLLLGLLRLRWVLQLPLPSMAAANGQCMFIEKNFYRHHQLHQQVKSSLVEDIAIMRYTKQQQARGAVLLGNGHISCRMYTNYKEAVSGFTKNLLAGFGGSYFGLLLYLLLVVIAPLVLAVLLPIASLLLLLFALAECLLLASLMQTNLLQQLLAFFPRLWALLQVGLASFAGAANKNYTWKGRTLNN